MASMWKAARVSVRLAPVALLILLLARCVHDMPTGAPGHPSRVVREHPNGCVPEVFTEYTDSTETILVTFEGLVDCFPALARWGIDMADPMGTDTPQGTAYWEMRSDYGAPSNFAANLLNIAQNVIEFDPPVRSVEFDYSRWPQSRALWGGMMVNSDSMRVQALERIPGTLWYILHDRKVLYSNASPFQFDAWTTVRFTAHGDKIQWMWFDGWIGIDNLRITRARQDTTFRLVSLTCSPTPVVRADTVSCNARWKPDAIPASEILFEWLFRGDSVRVFPSAQAEPFDPPPPIGDTAQGMSSWSGRAVLGGRVSLRATWQGDVDSASTRLEVNPRTSPSFGDLRVYWHNNISDIPYDSTKIFQTSAGPKRLPSPSGENFDTVSKTSNMATLIRGSPRLGSVTSGPNEGLWYVTDPGVASHRSVKINQWYTGREPPQFALTYVAGPLTHRGLLEARRKNAGGTGPRMHPDSTAALVGVWAHETYGNGTRKGHQQQIELAARSLATCGKVPAIVEGTVAPDSTVAADIANLVVEEGRKSLMAATWHDHVYGNFSNAPVYEVVFQVTAANNLNWVQISDVPKESTQLPYTVPDPRYDCRRTY